MSPAERVGIDLSVELPKAELCLRAEGSVVWKTTSRSGVQDITFCVYGLVLPVTVGMSPEERAVKQNISFDFLFNEKGDLAEDADIPYASIVTNVATVCGVSPVFLVERESDSLHSKLRHRAFDH